LVRACFRLLVLSEDTVNHELDFGLLDDVLPVAGAEAAAAEIMAARPTGLGPLVEYAFVAHQNSALLPPVDGLADCQLMRELRRVLQTGGFNRMDVSTARQGRDVEFHWCPLDPSGFLSPAWVTFRLRLQNAAERAGFNHSRRANTALAGYGWSEGRFEYVVADGGRGILASLRSCPEYADLQDAGYAIEVALTEGESCLGRGSGHGRGFSAVFLSLADLNGCLRFRSDDHALTINGASPDLSTAGLAQIGVNLKGFLVSVVCRPV
jgi:hypothetical protein